MGQVKRAYEAKTLIDAWFAARLQPQAMAALLGFEPRQSDSESLVLPLHYKAMDAAFETRDGEITEEVHVPQGGKGAENGEF